MGDLVLLPKKGESMMNIQNRTSQITTAMKECHQY